MHFAEKLSFLLHITKTSNKELAAELEIDRSMISLMRTGKRNLPRGQLLKGRPLAPAADARHTKNR